MADTMEDVRNNKSLESQCIVSRPKNNLSGKIENWFNHLSNGKKVLVFAGIGLVYTSLFYGGLTYFGEEGQQTRRYAKVPQIRIEDSLYAAQRESMSLRHKKIINEAESLVNQAKQNYKSENEELYGVHKIKVDELWSSYKKSRKEAK